MTGISDPLDEGAPDGVRIPQRDPVHTTGPGSFGPDLGILRPGACVHGTTTTSVTVACPMAASPGSNFPDHHRGWMSPASGVVVPFASVSRMFGSRFRELGKVGTSRDRRPPRVPPVSEPSRCCLADQRNPLPRCQPDRVVETVMG